MSIPEFATPEATRQFADQHQKKYSKNAYRQLGRTGLTVSRLGFGTYRCHAEVEPHKTALKMTLEHGCNLIDTSANYTDGMAEVLIGDVFNDFIVWNGKPREAYVIVSKVGYIQGDNMDIAKERENNSDPFPEVVKYHTDMWHCIHPVFIEDQITRSLARMHLDTLDVYLLHNPEYFLMHAEQQNFDLAAAEKQFYNRLRRAFVQMEKLVNDRLIRWYGISSNSFPLPADDPHHVSLAKVWTAYGDACLQLGIAPEEGHFAVIQLPFNMLENSAETEKNNSFQNENLTVLQLAEQLNLGVLANRPLNAIDGNRLLRLANYGAEPDTDYSSKFEIELEKAQQIEDELVSFVASENLQLGSEGKAFREFLQSSVHLRMLTRQNMDVSTFRMLLAQRLNPLTEFGKRVLLEKSNPESGIGKIIERYFAALQSAADVWLMELDRRNSIALKDTVSAFDSAHPQWQQQSLSQKALLQTLHSGEVHVSLVGMRSPEYVKDSLEVLKLL